ncbi:MAG: hypothetical protein ACOC1X_03495 [Promethearchaeota archaeon]
MVYEKEIEKLGIDVDREKIEEDLNELWENILEEYDDEESVSFEELKYKAIKEIDEEIDDINIVRIMTIIDHIENIRAKTSSSSKRRMMHR